MNSPLHTFFRHESERLVQNGQPPLSDEEIEELVGMCGSSAKYARERVDEYFKAREERLAKKSNIRNPNQPMNIPPKEFKIKLSFDDERRLRADFEEGGECSAIVSEPMTGDMMTDRNCLRNIRDLILDTVIERFYPPLTVPYKSSMAEVIGSQISVADVEELERRKIEHEKNFPKEIPSASVLSPSRSEH